MSALIQPPAELRAAGFAGLAGGLGHVVFAASGFAISAIAGLSSDFYPTADEVADLHWVGVAAWVISTVWAVCMLVATLTLGRLVWRPGSALSTIANAVAILAAGGMVSGIAVAQWGGAAADVAAAGASAETERAVLQGSWIAAHGQWYATTAFLVVWFVGFAVAARRTGVFRTLGLTLTILVAASAVLIVALTPYPTAGPFLSLWFIVTGIVLLVRARRAARALPAPSGAAGARA